MLNPYSANQQLLNTIKNNNLAYHNLCSHLTPPTVIGSLLGLGLEFSIKTMRPDKDSLLKACDRMRRDVRLKYYFAREHGNDKFNPRFYIKSEWDPDNASSDIQKQIDKFEQGLTFIQRDILNNTRPSNNLSLQEHFLLKLLNHHLDFIIVNTDKNLGPAIIERAEYIKWM